MRILYLDLDAMNPAHLSCYGYERPTSPTIDAIAAQGLRCTNVYTSDAPCLPSRTAFYSGRFGIHTGVVGHGGTAAEPKVEGPKRSFRDRFDTQGFARQLQLAGYHTAMVSPFGQRHAAWHFYAGFNEIHNTGRGGMEAAEEVTPVVDQWLDDHAAEDHWYLHINYWDVHTPYRAPMDYGEPFKQTPLPDWMVPAWEKWKDKPGPHSAIDIGMYKDATDPKYPRVPDRLDSPEKLKQYIDGYDTAVRYVDDQIKHILGKLEAAGVLDDTLIIISADHGENQGDMGIYGEHGTADHATCHLPFIVKGPGVVQGHVDDGLHYNVDWAPTLMDLLGREAQPIWDGRSFADTVRDGTDAGRDQLVVSQCCHVCQRSARWGDWLYIRTYHDGFHDFPQEMLFNLADDPHEQVNVADRHPELCREGAHRLAAWHDEQMQKMARWSSDVVDPLWSVIRDGGPFHANILHRQPSTYESYIQRLKDTGRRVPASLQAALDEARAALAT